MIDEIAQNLGKEKAISFLEGLRYMYSCMYYTENDLKAVDIVHYIDNKIEVLNNG